MNLRKTVAGAAVALGSATVMLGLGGIANADTGSAAVHTSPDLGGQLGDVASVSDLASVNTADATGKIQAINAQDLDAAALVENVDAGATGLPASTLLGLNEPHGVPTGAASVDI
ncbi:hypothetical protein SAMN04488074_106230 [Lentzea albidocapillata subsp. violacea]|uniref:Secreted protein n=1 Tax=Lentzea albidocapillata subsp. violacea TaxID=128104 RepID=A0A1G9DE18_9PSEU|nr:hypothetical protein [Lentzea albidocapillata]SDK62113.1 hypothetical protein SAMN04488074_106230 [Lentzea albidocapillata subsp. violacea]